MGINSGYIGVDKRVDSIGVIDTRKHYLERLAGRLSGQLFNPIDISGMLLWMDSSVLGLSNNASVATWTPFDGDGNETATIIGTPQPTYKTGVLNGLGVVEFVAGEGRLRGTLTDASTSTTIFGLARLTTAGHDRVFSGVYPPRNWLLGWHSSASTVSMYGGSFINSAVATDTNWRLMSFRQSGTSGQLWIDGTSGGTSGSQTDYLGPAFAFSGYDSANTNETTSSQIAEFIVYNSSLSVSDRQKVEGFMAWKWGLEANLPVGHPYLSGPP